MPVPEVASYARRFGLTVTPENVLGIREVVLDEANALQDLLWREERTVWLPKLGDDPVSGDMKREFNLVTKSLLDAAHQHIDSLLALGNELAETARAYGHTEEQIKAKFARTEVSKLSPLFKQAAGVPTASAQPAPGSWQDLVTGDRT